MVALTFPDGARREYPNGIAGLDVAKGISPSLAKRTVAMALDGVVADLSDPIEHDARIEFLSREDKRALELIRHDAAHVLAEAVQNLWRGTQVTIGPVIENGFYYDFFRNQPFTPEDFPAIEAEMRKIVARDRPFTKEVWDREKAKQVFRDKGELFKVELVDAIPEGEPIKIYKQGDWFDLCRGPHMTSTGKVGSAFKLMKTAGAYWRGDSNNPMLTRIYGTAFPSQAELDAYLKQIEEAEKRDHRRLGREMDLFHFQEEAPGSVFWHAKGWTLFRLLEDYIRRRQTAAGYLEVNAPQLMDSSLWVASGHMETFRESMFLTQPREEDERVFVVKPMNCPGHVQIFKNGLKSYRDLPFRLAEFGKVHRFEPSGALHGLMRVRAFTQDDAHVFITEDDIARESLAMNDLILSIYEDFGFSDVSIKFSDRPEKRIGADEVWDKAEAALKHALESSKRPWTLNKGEGAFYGPKLEYVLRDAIGRDWQCGTVQVDLNMPGRLGAFYIDDHSNKVTPVMLHRAMFGSLERFTGIMIEHYAGHLPLWLAPVQAVVATITSDADEYAREAVAAAQRLGLRVEDDLRNEKINFKVREHSLAKIPALLVVGKKEATDRAVSIRRLGSQQQTVMPLDRALAMLADEAVAPDLRRMKQAASTPKRTIQINITNELLDRVCNFGVGFLKFENNGQNATSAGTGTFVKLGKVKGIITAGHVVAHLPKAKVGLVRFPSVEPALQNFKLDVEHACSVPMWDGKEGQAPDLAFLRIPDLDAVNLEAHGAAFYDLGRERKFAPGKPNHLMSKAYAIVGVIAEWAEDAPGTRPRTKKKIIGGLFGAAKIAREFKENGIDLIEVEIDYASSPRNPASYEGVSGGALWELHVELDGERVTNVNKKLHGVAFRQSDDHRFVVSNGPSAIESLVSSIKAKWPTDV
jgi:threonyl-tRNA synthetase